MSGYLVLMSYEKARSPGDHAGKRVRRAYLPYFVVACALLGATITILPPAEYLSDGVVAYRAANLVLLNFLAPNLPGVFDANPFTKVNGALWTLKAEVTFYAIVPLIALLCRRLGTPRVLAAFYLASVAYHLALGHLAAAHWHRLSTHLQRQLPGQPAYFVAGAAGFYFGDVLAWRWGHIDAVAVAGYTMLVVALGAATIAVLALAAFSWHFVEKPFLHRSSHYVLAEAGRI